MVEKCDKDCKDVRILNDAVFGEHQDGLTYKIEKKQDISCMNKYIKKPHISIIVLCLSWLFVVSASSVTTGYKLYFGQESAPLLYAEKDDVKDNKADIMLLKQGLESLNKNIEQRAVRVDHQFEEQNKKIEKGFDEIKDFMKVIIRHNRSKDK